MIKKDSFLQRSSIALVLHSGYYEDKDVTPQMLEAGHGGMDWFAYKAFVDAVKNGTQTPVDVYDSAVWQAVSVLSEISIAQGGAPQAMPDFTGGAWMRRPRLDVCEF